MPAGEQRLYPDERRVVTVLFVDLTGFTELAEQRDPEDVTDLINRYFEAVTAVIEGYGGFVDKFLGDAVMAVFGAPRSQGDDPERAVRAALDVLRRVREVNRDSAEPISVHVGIETGRVVAGYVGSPGRMDYTVIGDAVNTAARIQGLAGSNQVLIGPGTHERTSDLFDYAAHGAVALKGKRDPVPLYEPLRVVSRVRPSEDGRVRLASFAGRQEERSLLDVALTAVLGGGGRAVVVQGEPGIGKSRLVREFVQSLPSTVEEVGVQCESIGGMAPLEVFVLLLARLWRLKDETRPADDTLDSFISRYDLNRAAIRDLFGLPPEDTGYRQLSPPSKHLRLTAGVTAALTRFEHPLVVVIDDVQWADAASLDLIGNLLDSLGESSVLLVLVARPEFDPRWLSHPSVVQLPLSSLPEASCRVVIRDLFGSPVPDEVEEDLLGRSGGNPFFIEELVRALRSRMGGQRRSAAIGEELPDTIHGVLTARIDGLDDRPRRVLQSASVIGPRFDEAVLGSVLSDTGVQTDLATLVAEGLLVRTSADSREYEFVHALTREVAYDTLLRKSRRSLHAAVAVAIEARLGDLADSRAATLAYHHAAAGQAVRAIDYWLVAAQQSIQRSANAGAITYLETALEHLRAVSNLEARDALELRLRTALGAALMATQGPGSPVVEETYLRARDVARASADAREHFPVLFGLFRFFLLRARLSESEELAQDMLRFARRFEDTDMMLEAQFANGAVSFWLGRLDIARSHWLELEASSKWVRSDDHVHRFGQDPEAIGLAYAGWTAWLLGRGREATRIAQRARERAASLEHAFSKTYAYLGLAILSQLRNDPEHTAAYVDTAQHLARVNEFPYFQAIAALIGTWADAKIADAHASVERFGELLPPFYATGARANETYYALLHADACLAATEVDQGLKAIDGALEQSQVTGETVWVPELLRLRGELLDEAGRTAEAEEAFEDALSVARACGATELELRTLLTLYDRSSDGGLSAIRQQLELLLDRYPEPDVSTEVRRAETLL